MSLLSVLLGSVTIPLFHTDSQNLWYFTQRSVISLALKDEDFFFCFAYILATMFVAVNFYISLVHITKVRCKLLSKSKSRVLVYLTCLSKQLKFQEKYNKLRKLIFRSKSSPLESFLSWRKSMLNFINYVFFFLSSVIPSLFSLFFWV